MYTRSDIEVLCGSNQLCAGLKTGVEGLFVLYMSDLFHANIDSVDDGSICW